MNCIKTKTEPRRASPGGGDDDRWPGLDGNEISADGEAYQAPHVDLREAARRYAAEGVPIFPLAPGTNRPLEKGYREGMSRDPKERLGAWEKNPDCNVGLFLVGRVVIDVDQHGDADGERSLEALQAQLGELSPTYTVRTPRNGKHLHFSTGKADVRGKIDFAPGVDILGSRRHAVLPPSVRDDGAYVVENDAPVAPLPRAWLSAILASGNGSGTGKQQEQGGPADLPQGPGISYGTIVERARKYVSKYEGAPQGSRNNAMYRVACALQNDFSLDKGLAWGIFCSANRKNSPPLNMDELRQVFASAAQNASKPRGALISQPKKALPPPKPAATPRPVPVVEGEMDEESPGGVVWDAEPTENRVQPILTMLSDVVVKPVEWLWPGKIALGKLTLIAGDPGLGKSWLTLDLAARVTTGEPWPGESGGPREPAGVLLVSLEDTVDDTVTPRFLACGGDPAMAAAYEGQRETDENGKPVAVPFTLRSLDGIEAALDGMSNAGINVRLIAVDPISAAMGDADSHNNAEVRGALVGLAELAAGRNLAAVCVTHLRKGQGRAIYRAMGSLAFVAAARAAYVVCADPNDEQRRGRLFLPIKNNLAPDRSGFAFSIVEPWGGGCPRVRWGARVDAGDVDSLLNPVPGPRGPAPSARDDAAEWLEAALADGPKPAKEILRDGRLDGHTERTLKRAKQDLGVDAKKNGYGAEWLWVLPSSKGAKGGNIE